MRQYQFGLVPGPTTVPKHILQKAYSTDIGSSDFEPEFFELYKQVQNQLRQLLNVGSASANQQQFVAGRNIVVMCGEAMLGLWGGLKSIVTPTTRVLSIAAGVYGFGVADMAKQCGVREENVRVYGLQYNEIPTSVFADAQRNRNLLIDVFGDAEASHWQQRQQQPQQSIEEVIVEFRPDVITVIHCDTPSGTLIPSPIMKAIGELSLANGSLLYVDFVSSGAGAEVRVSDWNIDIGILGSQKALSLPPNLTILTVSERAWNTIEEIKYQGYDAILAWKTILEDGLCPYTHDWHALLALHFSLEELLSGNGLEAVFKRHKDIAAYTRQRLREMRIELFPIHEAFASPTITAALVPDAWTWEQFDTQLRNRGVVFAGSYGPLKDRVFRIGHMGSQADLTLVTAALDILQQVLQQQQ